MKYLVEWTEEVEYSVEVEAASPEEAEAKAYEEEAYERAAPDYIHGTVIVENSVKVKEVQA